MKRIRKLLKNEYLYAVLSKIVVVTIGVFYSGIFARYCGPTIKGEIAVVNSIISLGAIIITFGMHQAYPFYRRKYGAEWYKDVFLSVVTTLFLCYGGISVLSVIILQGALPIEWITAILLMPILGYANVVSYVTTVEMPNYRNTIFMGIHFLELLYIIVLWKFFVASFWGAISAFALAEILKAFTYTLVLKPRVRSFSWINVKELYTYGFFPMLGLLMTTLNYKIDIFVLKSFPNISNSEIGIYSVGVTLAEKVLLIPDSMKQILMSKLAKGKTSQEVAKVSRLCFCVSLLCTVGVLLFGKLILQIIFGKEFVSAYNVTLICVAGTAPMVFFKMIGQYNIINKKQICNVAMLALSIMVNVFVNLLLIPRLGILGAAIGTMIGHIVCAVVFVVYFSKTTGTRITEIVFIQKQDVDVVMKKIGKNRR